VPIATNQFVSGLISRATVAIELAFLPLVMIPSVLMRGAAVVGAAGLHLGILFLMNVGNFPVIMLSSLVLFLPGPWVYDGVETMFGRLQRLMPTRIRVGAAHLIDVLASRSSTRPPVWTRGQRARGLSGALLVLTAVLAFATAVPTQWEGARPRGDLASLLRFLSLDQSWNMFSPDPARSDGWTVIPAKLVDGTAVDLLHGKPVDPRSERWSDPLYSRWVKVEERIASVDFSDYRLEYARYFCRTRNLHLRPGQVALDTFDVHYLERVIPPPGESAPQLRDITLWSHKC
jgi:hypothetical protein